MGGGTSRAGPIRLARIDLHDCLVAVAVFVNKMAHVRVQVAVEAAVAVALVHVVFGVVAWALAVEGWVFSFAEGEV